MELRIAYTGNHNIKNNGKEGTARTSSNSTATASPTITAMLVTLNVSSRAVDDSGWLQQDLVWTTVHIIL